MISTQHKNFHILIVDDHESIHADLKKILKCEDKEQDMLFQQGRDLFGEASQCGDVYLPFDVVSAFNGLEGFREVEHSVAMNYPFSVAFVDVRMPGGIEGVELVKRIWSISPDTQIVMCTACTDFELSELWDWSGRSDQLVILKKPFDNIEVLQLAHALTKKWDLMQTSRLKMEDLTKLADTRAEKLQRANTILEAEIEHHKKTALKLDEARRLAEAALEARRAFLANISHEIRTPLNGIMGMNELLLETGLDEEQKEYSLHVVECSQSLLGIINDILDFSKMDAGQLEVEDEEFDLNEVLESSLSKHRHIATRVGLNFNEICDVNNHPRLIGDASRVIQVMDNLLSNAIKFTHNGSVIFELSTEYETEDEVSLRFTVKDTGVGIGPGIQRNLFQPFTQADSSTTRNYGGTGLGLAICKNLVGLMRGRMDFQSDGHNGSRFWFTIPFKKVKDAACSNLSLAEGEDNDKSESRCSPTRAHILVAEDSPIGQAIVRKHLEFLGCRTTIVANGKQALEAVKKAYFDLVLLDCQMPEMNGFETAYQVRKLNNDHSKVPIVALTASTIDEAKDQCIAAGMDDFLLKPVSRSRLGQLLDEVLA